MVKLVKKVSIALFVAVFFTGSVMAFEKGIAIGVTGQQLNIDADGSEIVSGAGKERVTPSSISKSADVGSIFVEFVGDYGSIGVEYVPGAASLGSKTRTDTSEVITAGTYTAKAEVSGYTTVYVEPTYMVNETFGLYLKGGVSRLSVDTLENLKFGASSSEYPNKEIWGALGGFGVKAAHSSGFFAKLDHSSTFFKPLKFVAKNGTNPIPNVIQADLDVTTTRLAIGYTF